jgi:septal ring factor EnvC (AmiA/AmiB activator)
MHFRTYQELNLLTREQLIREIMQGEIDHAKRLSMHESALAEATRKLAVARSEGDQLHAAVLEGQAEIARLQAARSELVSAELTKLRKQLAEAKGRGG